MTAYTTRDLAAALIDDAEDNPKAAGRTLRKFLRTDFAARDLQTPGKGGRYALELNKRDLTAMAKRFAAWSAKEAEDKAARAALKAELAAKPAPVVEAEVDPLTLSDDEYDDEGDPSYEGPSDDDIAALISDDEDIDEL